MIHLWLAPASCKFSSIQLSFEDKTCSLYSGNFCGNGDWHSPAPPFPSIIPGRKASKSPGEEPALGAGCPFLRLILGRGLFPL